MLNRRFRHAERPSQRRRCQNVGAIKVAGQVSRIFSSFAAAVNYFFHRRAPSSGRAIGRGEKARRFGVVAVHHDDFVRFGRAGEFADNRQFGRAIFFKRAVRLKMFRREVGKNQGVEGQKFVSELAGALAGHFNHRRVATGPLRPAQKFLDEAAAGHRHFLEIALAPLADFKMKGGGDGDAAPGRGQNRTDQFGRRRLAFGAGDADDEKLPSRKAVANGGAERQKIMIN